MTLKKVLFVCTGNIFRSMSAQYCAQAYCKKHGLNSFLFHSAGTEPQILRPDECTFATLSALGIHANEHVPRQLTPDIFSDADIVVAMAKSHQDFIFTHYNKQVALYNDLATNCDTSVDDICEAFANPSRDDEIAHIRKTVLYIYDTIPALIEALTKIK